MQLPCSDNSKPRVADVNSSEDHRLESLKASLRTAYKLVAKANKRSHQRNKKLYDRKSKTHHFAVNDLVYLYWPVTKPGLTRKFRNSWSGPYKISRKISETNYEIVDQRGKKHIVHVNRLKRSYDQSLWNCKSGRRARRKAPKQSDENLESSEKDEIKIGPFPLTTRNVPSNSTEHTSPRNQGLYTPGSDAQALENPSSEQADLSYRPPETPRSRRELQTTRTDPPATRSRTRILSQDTTNV
jgi:hypothetical protein